jgi:hypothetical protein
MSQARPMTEVTSAYDQWARTYETVENATRDLAATVLRQYPLHMHDRDVLDTRGGARQVAQRAAVPWPLTHRPVDAAAALPRLACGPPEWPGPALLPGPGLRQPWRGLLRPWPESPWRSGGVAIPYGPALGHR